MEINQLTIDTLQTERLILRPLREDDTARVHEWASVPENVRYMSWGPNDEQATRAFVMSARSGFDFAVELKANGLLIGSCGIYPDDRQSAEIGWILHRDHHRQGYGTELGRRLLAYGFGALKLRRVYSFCAAANRGSYRLMEKIGMRREAVHRKAVWARVDKEWIDQYIYAILADEYEKGTAQDGPLPLDAVVLDCGDVKQLTAFYADLLAWQIDFIDEPNYGRVAPPGGGTRILIQFDADYERPVWPQTDGKAQQQAHLDFAVADEAALKRAVERALRCGAKEADEQFGFNEETGRFDWYTMIDPAGHPFCFVIW